MGESCRPVPGARRQLGVRRPARRGGSRYGARAGSTQGYEPVPEAGDTADERSVLKATPRTAFEAVVPVVRSSTVLN